MTFSILDSALKIHSTTKSFEQLKMFLETIGVTTFQPLYGKEDAYTLILFVLIGFSQDSPKIVSNQDFRAGLKNICEFLEVKGEKQTELVKLSDSTLKKVIAAYLTEFAGAEFARLQFLKIQFADAQDIITQMLCRKVVAEEEGVIIGTEFDAATHARLMTENRKTAKDIVQTEKELKVLSKYKPLFIEQIMEGGVNKKQNITLSIENNEHIK